MNIPKRNSLVLQTLDALREEIKKRTWRNFLPGERRLCRLLHVSRPTIRAALESLRREGLIMTSCGKKRQITWRRTALPRERSRVVGMLSRAGEHCMTSFEIFMTGQLRAHLQKHGYQLEVFSDSKLLLKHPRTIIAGLPRPAQIACWVLVSTPEPVQRAFSEAGLPAFVVGSCFQGVELPSLDVDYRAICHHAVGVLSGLGHRRLAFIAPKSKLAGNLAAAEGFRQGLDRSPHGGLHGVTVYHDGEKANLIKAVDSLIRGNQSPTALIVSGPSYLLTVLTHLLRLKRSVPEDISLISRDDHPHLEDLDPEITRYTYDLDNYTARVSRLVVQLATVGVIGRRQNLLMPRLEKGASVGPPRPNR